MNNNNFKIIKKKIELNNLDEYNPKKLKQSENILKETISNT